MKKLFAEPLLHFAILGGLLFGLFEFVANPSPQDATQTEQITVSEGQIRRLILGFEKVWQRQPTPEELDRLIESHIRDEVLYREALTMGLDVDDPVVLRRLLETLTEISERLPLVFPIHPRTRARVKETGLDSLLAQSRIGLTEPLGYLQLLGLMEKSRLVLTDSGGLQEESTALGVPCITLRENTERPITVTKGTNTIVGTDQAKIRNCFDDVMANGGKAGRIPDLWDGHAAERIAARLLEWADRRSEAA